MNTIKNLGSTGIYAYTTLISVFICAPGIFIYEKVGGHWGQGLLGQGWACRRPHGAWWARGGRVGASAGGSCTMPCWDRGWAARACARACQGWRWEIRRLLQVFLGLGQPFTRA